MIYHDDAYKRDPYTKQRIKGFGENGALDDATDKGIMINVEEALVNIKLD